MTTRALLTLTLALAAPLAQGQEPAASKPAPAPEPAPAPSASGSEVKIKDSTGGMHKAGNETLSVDFPDEDIREILRSVADLFDLNLVIPDTLVGKTSVKLRDVSWRQIFQVVLAPVKYTYIEDNNIIKIVSEESLQQERTDTEIFILNYARAADVLPTVGSLVDAGAGGRIVVDARSNALVITERPSRLKRVRPIIETLDRATDQVMIESKFIEVTDKDLKDVGVKWQSLQNMQVGVRGGGEKTGDFGSFDRSTGASRSTENESTTKYLGVDSGTTSKTGATGSTQSASGSSASNSATVTTTNGVPSSTATSTTSSGLSSSSESGTSSSSSIVNNASLNALQNLAAGGTTGRNLTAVFNASEFSMVLSALTSLTGTRVVSNPTVVTLNNTDAIINVGEEFPIPKFTYNQERGTYEVSNFEFRPIGVILKVTPQVNNRGFIKLTLEPEVSQRNGTTNFGTASIPIIATRKAKTNVSLKDGYTMGIGGMIRKQTTDTVTKVPFLGDLPIIGNAFKHKSKNAETTNLLIFITAKVVSSDGATVEQVIDPRQAEEMKLQRSDLPGYRKNDGLLLPPAEDIKPATEEKKTSWWRRNTSKK